MDTDTRRTRLSILELMDEHRRYQRDIRRLPRLGSWRLTSGTLARLGRPVPVLPLQIRPVYYQGLRFWATSWLDAQAQYNQARKWEADICR